MTESDKDARRSVPGDVSDPLSRIPRWLANFDNPALKERILNLGRVTGWRRYEDGSYGAPNFERALVLDRIIEIMRPSSLLEIGTGRGLGCLAAAAAARAYGVGLDIATIDVLGPDDKQEWAIQLNGADSVVKASRREIWANHIDKDLPGAIEQITGTTEKALPTLAGRGRKFDLVFIDAGHDPYSVIHDLAFAIRLLNTNGAVLMDDFAPLDEYGLGACLAIPHAKQWFRTVMVFHTEGLVYGGAENPDFPRGMALFHGLARNPDGPPGAFRLLWWKFASYIVSKSYRTQSFPLR